MFDISAGNVIVGSLSATSIPFLGSDKKLTQSSNFTYNSAANRLDISNISGIKVLGNIDLSGNTLQNGNILISAGRQIDISAGTFITNSNQKLSILQGAASNINFGLYDISAGNVIVNGVSNSITANNAIFKTVSEVGNVITIGGSNSISVDYRNNGAVLYWTATGTVAGPYTFNITNVPDLTTQSHIVTALTTAPSTNITTQYFSTISINGGTATSVLWSNGTLPDLADVAVGNVIVQQFSILPSNFISPQKVLSNVNYFK
jgi:hypothetical protein